MAPCFQQTTRIAASVAAVCFATAVAGFGHWLDGYLQSVYPVAALGARGMPRALAFNIAGFIVPGALAVFVAWRLRESLPRHAPLVARVGAWMVLMSAGGFALQGAFPLDPQDLDAPASQAHSLAWTLWWVAFTPGALLSLVGWRRAARGRIESGLRRPRTVAAASGVLALAVSVCAVFAGALLGPAIAQRLAFGAWFAWLLVRAFGMAGTAPALDPSRMRSG